MTRILLIGLGPTALTALDALLRDFSVVGVVRRMSETATSRIR